MKSIRISKHNKKLFILSNLALVLILGGLSYALFNYVFIGDTNAISTEDLSVEFLEGTNKMNITNALPISDEQGKASNSFDFVVKSNTSRNTNIVYTISLEKLSASSGYTSLNDSDIDIYLTSGNKVLKNVTKVSELNNYELYRTTHVHNSTNREVQTKYSLRAWIDKDVDASNWKSTTKLEYNFRVNVEALEVEPATQSVTTGSATDLNISSIGISTNVPANETEAKELTLNAYPGGETFNITTEESTLSYEIKLTDENGNDIITTNPVAVQINIGTGLEVKSMMHGSTTMTKATSHAADTYEYDKTTGILTMYVTHFSEFKISYKIIAFASDSWNTIISNVKKKNTSKYNVGDEKVVDMGKYGMNIVRIANKSTPSECNNKDFSETSCGFVVEFVDVVTTYNMNDDFIKDGGWPSCKMRTFMNNEIYDALPNEIKDGIIDTRVISGYANSNETNFTSIDKLYLLSTHEVWEDDDGNNNIGIDHYDTAYNNTKQLDYYNNLKVTINNKSQSIKKYGNNVTNWWLRTARSYHGYDFLYVNTSGNCESNYSTRKIGVSPAFRIG